MNGKIYNEILDELQRRRNKGIALADKRKEEVYAIIPQIPQIDDEIRGIGIRLGLLAIKGNKNKDELESRLSALIKRKEDLIKKKGYSGKYLDDVFDCEICGDTGFVYRNGEYERCVCFKRLLIEKLLQDSNVSYAGGTFTDFDLDMYSDEADEEKYGIKISPRENQERILKRCRDFVDNFKTRAADNLIFIGKSGLGKTFMCNSIAVALLERGIPVLYLTAPILFTEITGMYSRNDAEREKANEMRELIMNTELLIIDDLGTERQTATRYAELLDILNTRELLSKKRTCKTIMSTNLEPANIFEYYGERVASRIIGGFDMIPFAGEDIRIKLRMQKHNTIML